MQQRKAQQTKFAHFQPDYNIQQRVRADERQREFAVYANK